MSILKHFFVGIIFLVGIGSLNAQPIALQNYMKKHHDKNIGLLFMHQAKQAQIRPLQEHACYQLTLMHIKPNLLYFSDRPQRFAGYMRIPAFIKFWSRNKLSHNAVLHGERRYNQPDSSFSRVVTITEPRYNPIRHSLSYKACLTDRHSEPRIKIRHLSNVTLFVDEFQYGWG